MAFVEGVLLALVLGVILGISTGFISGSSSMTVFWGVVFFVYLSVETQQQLFLGAFVVVLIGVGLAVAAYLMRFFFGSAQGGP